MPLTILPLLLLLGLVSTTSVTQGAVLTTQQEKDVVNFVESVRKCRGLMGLSVAVVKGDGSWTRGFGTKNRITNEKVNSSHLMGIGAVTKAFTSALLSILLNNHSDKYRNSWDTPVKDILRKDFELIDDELTHQVTLKDILTHSTGLDSLDLPFLAGSSLTMEELARQIRHLPVKTPLQKTFDYNNLVYSLLGHVTELMGGGKSWETLLTDHLLVPLGMSSTKVFGPVLQTTDPIFARPYVLHNGIEVIESDHVIYSISPQQAAAGIASSADDMVKFLKMLTNKGKSQAGLQLLNQTLFHNMTSSQINLDEGLRYFISTKSHEYPVSLSSESYGYGWMTASYRDHPVVWHPGFIFGYTSFLAFLPDQDLGFYICNNGPGLPPTGRLLDNQLIFYYLADVLLPQTTPWLSNSTACPFPPREFPPPQNQPPSVHNFTFQSAAKYIGRYEQPLFGEVWVLMFNDHGLTFHYGHLRGRLFHGDKDDVAFGRVEGVMAFMFRRGNTVFYLSLKFEDPSGPRGSFKKITLSDRGDHMVFQRQNVVI